MRNAHYVALCAALLSPLTAAAQDAGQTLPAETAIPTLMFFTLVAGLAVAVGAFVYFLRKRSNRAAAARALGGDDQRRP
jgi:hypothetical protein